MQFEFNSKKSVANQVKHGINFEQAQEIWLDSSRVEIPAKVMDEPRTLVIGRIKAKVWSAVVTLRGESIRIIPVRRARKEKEEIYESEGL